GSDIPSLMDSRIPGTDNKCSVSWTAAQSLSDSRTAFERLPEIRIGSCDSAAWSIRRYRLARASLAVNAVIGNLRFQYTVRHAVRVCNHLTGANAMLCGERSESATATG